MILENIFKGQDFNALKMCEKVLNDEKLDPITQIIVDAWKDNGGDAGEFDKEGYKMDMQYAINQLQKALNVS